MGKRKDAAKKAADRMRADLLKSRTLAIVAMNWVVVDQKRAAMLVPAPADSEGQKGQTGTIGDIVPSPERDRQGHTPIGVSPCPPAVSDEGVKLACAELTTRSRRPAALLPVSGESGPAVDAVNEPACSESQPSANAADRPDGDEQQASSLAAFRAIEAEDGWLELPS